MAAQEGSVRMSPETTVSSLCGATLQIFLQSMPLVAREAHSAWLILIGRCFLLGPGCVQMSHVFSCACAVTFHRFIYP